MVDHSKGFNNFHRTSDDQKSYGDHSFLNSPSPKPIPMKHMGLPPKPTKLHRAVRERHAEIKLRKNRTGLWLGEFGEYKPLHSSADVKLQPICQDLADMQKPSKTEKLMSSSEKSATGRSNLGPKEAQPQTVMCSEENSISGEIDLDLWEYYFKVEASASPALLVTESEESAGPSPLSDLTFTEGSAGPSPLSDLTFADVNEPQWGVASDGFNLHKYRSCETDWDWDSLLS